jgi:hypothetical protein
LSANTELGIAKPFVKLGISVLSVRMLCLETHHAAVPCCPLKGISVCELKRLPKLGLRALRAAWQARAVKQGAKLGRTLKAETLSPRSHLAGGCVKHCSGGAPMVG